MKMKVLRRSVAILCLLTAGFCIYRIVGIFSMYRGITEKYERMSEAYLREPEIADGSMESLPEIDFDGIRAVNPDVIAWLYIPDTGISYPVLKSYDNADYLYMDYRKNFSAEGSIFLDSRSSADLTDPNTVLYGHNMKNGAMFGGLDKYGDREYRLAHDRGFLLKPEGTVMEFEIVDSYTVSIHDGEVYRFGPAGDQAAGPETLILSTCTEDSRDSQRYVLECLVK